MWADSREIWITRLAGGRRREWGGGCGGGAGGGGREENWERKMCGTNETGAWQPLPCKKRSHWEITSRFLQHRDLLDGRWRGGQRCGGNFSSTLHTVLTMQMTVKCWQSCLNNFIWEALISKAFLRGQDIDMFRGPQRWVGVGVATHRYAFGHAVRG